MVFWGLPTCDSDWSWRHRVTCYDPNGSGLYSYCTQSILIDWKFHQNWGFDASSWPHCHSCRRGTSCYTSGTPTAVCHHSCRILITAGLTPFSDCCVYSSELEVPLPPAAPLFTPPRQLAPCWGTLWQGCDSTHTCTPGTSSRWVGFALTSRASYFHSRTSLLVSLLIGWHPVLWKNTPLVSR